MKKKQLIRKESSIQKAVMQYLEVRGYMPQRRNSGKVTKKYTNKKGIVRERWINLGKKGTADILCFVPRWVKVAERNKDYNYWDAVRFDIPTWIEVKSAVGKQTLHQRLFQEQVEQRGHKYYIVRSVYDFEEIGI